MQTRLLVNLISARLEVTCKLTPRASVSSVRQRRIITELLEVLFARRGRVTFANLARFSSRHEQTFRRHLARAIGWLGFNLAVLHLRIHPRETLIGVFGCTLLPESGSKTYGLDRFFCTTRRRT